MSEKEFLEDLKELVDKHPDKMKELGVVRGPKTPDVYIMERRRCKRWGQLPGTNQLVCLEWEDL